MIQPEQLLFSYRWSADVYEKLVSDVADADFVAQPVEGINHPAWIFGHVTTYHDVIAAMLRGESFDNPWDAPCGKNSSPLPDRSAYPGKDQILKLNRDGVEQTCAVMASAPAEAWSAALGHPTWGKQFESVAPAAIFLATSHYALHLGQLSGWRRAMALPRI